MQRTKPLLWASVFLLVCSAVAGDCLPATILLNVLDRHFEIRNPNLRNTDLRVVVDNKPVQILAISRDSHPRRIVLLVDTSGSMEASRQKTGWGITLPAAAYAVDVLPQSASAALVTFSDKLQRESSNFETRQAVGGRVLDLKGKQPPHGRSLLFDSIHQVLIDLTQLQFGDAIYVVTDGGENGSKTSLPQLKQELASRGIRIFCFLVRHEKRSDEEISGASRMEDLAEFTGGNVVRISAAEIGGASRGQLQQLAPGIIGQAESFYRVELGIPSAQKAGRVTVSFVHKGNANIAYSHQIGLCPPTGTALN